MKKTLLGALLLMGLLAFFSQAQAVSVPFSLNGSYTTGMGFQRGYNGPDKALNFDHLTVTGVTGGAFNTTGGNLSTGVGSTATNVRVAELKFDVGYNAWTAHDSYGYLQPISITVGGTTVTDIKIPYKIRIDVKDSLWLYATKVVFQNSAGTLNYSVLLHVDELNSLNFAMKTSGEYKDYLTADIKVSAVPLPPAFALMLSGLGLLGFGARRKKGADAAP